MTDEVGRMDGMGGIAEFLLARIAEDEEVAREATPGPWEAVGHVGASGEVAIVVAEGYGFPAECADMRGEPDAAHIARHDPARVLAECEAKRRIVDLHALARTMGHQCVAIDGPTQHHMADPCATLRLLALPYADHPDYREEWRA